MSDYESQYRALHFNYDQLRRSYESVVGERDELVKQLGNARTKIRELERDLKREAIDGAY